MLAVVVMLVTLAAVGHAQAPTSPPARPPVAARPIDRGDLRHQIYVMEGALTRAVEFGAQRLNREIRSVAPEMIALSGVPQARGIYLDGYGVYFDVGVPILHQSMVWTLRTLGQDSRDLAELLQTFRQVAKGLTGAARLDMDRAISRLELQLGPLAGTPATLELPTPAGRSSSPTVGASLVGQEKAEPSPAPPPQTGLLDKKFLQDPNALNRAYTDSVQRALIDAMIDYSAPMALGPDEYLTVGARDNMVRDSLAPPDPYEEVITLLLRIKGSDLSAYRSQQIDRDEVRRRVQVREF